MKNWIIYSLLVFLLIIILFLLGYFLTNPEYESEYFTDQYLRKYNSPEATFQHYINSIRAGDPDYYQEVIGRRIDQKERKHITENIYRGKVPKIKSKIKKKNYVYIITDNNWGINLEKVNGRWLFSPEDLGFYYREFFRILGYNNGQKNQNKQEGE